MGKVGNSTNQRDVSDITARTHEGGTPGHRGGRRTSSGNSTTAGGPGRKEQSLANARSTNKAHVKAFRSGLQDARDGAIMAGRGPTGSVSRHPQTTIRRGSGSGNRFPSPSGGA